MQLLSMKLSRLLHTVRHLKPRQVYYRLYYLLRRRVRGNSLVRYRSDAPQAARRLTLKAPVPRLDSLCDGVFTFLNTSHRFESGVEWNFARHGKLWCYNLNYFDFLNQGDLAAAGLALIRSFIAQSDGIRDGLEPYPTSLRIINWIKFLTREEICDPEIDSHLLSQARLLRDNLEYHLLGNHLLENAFALLFAGVYLDSEELLAVAGRLLQEELAEQVLPDGGHFELSPMYHRIVLDRLLDCVNLLQNNGPDRLLPLLRDKSASMLGWLRQLTFPDGEIPLLNDSADGISPDSQQLFEYASRLGIAAGDLPLKESGYRRVTRSSYDMVLDVGRIGPDYLPGHAHSDTLSFVLYGNGLPFLIDTGTSTYEPGPRRHAERSTRAHNTVLIEGMEQSEVWGSFRVARRAYVRELVEAEHSVSASHTGYLRVGAVHSRRFDFDAGGITITDRVSSSRRLDCRAFFHFHPGIEICVAGASATAAGHTLEFTGASGLRVESYFHAPRFNVLVPAQLLVVSFDSDLQTRISLGHSPDPAAATYEV